MNEKSNNPSSIHETFDWPELCKTIRQRSLDDFLSDLGIDAENFNLIALKREDFRIALLAASSPEAENDQEEGEIFQGNALQQIHSVPGITNTSRGILSNLYDKLRGTKLLYKALERAKGGYPVLQKKTDEEKPTDFPKKIFFVDLAKTEDNKNQSLEITFADHPHEERQGFLGPFDLGEGYGAHISIDLLGDRLKLRDDMGILNQKQKELLRNAVSFPCRNEEKAIIAALQERILEDVEGTTVSPYIFREPYWMRYLKKTTEGRDFNPAEARAFVDFLEAHDIRLLTSERFALYNKFSGKNWEDKGRLSKKIFREVPPEITSYNIKVAVDTMLQDSPGTLVEDLRSEKILSIVHACLGPGISSSWYLFNKFYPDYAVLTPEKAQSFMKSHHRKKIHLSSKFFHVPDPHSYRDHRFSDEERERILQRTQENVRIAIKTYLQLHPEKTLDTLGVRDLWSISKRALFYPFTKQVQKQVLLNRAFPDEYGVLDKRKFSALMEAKGHSTKRRMSQLYFDSGDKTTEQIIEGQRRQVPVYTPEEFRKIKNRSLKNARFAIHEYLALHPEKDLNTLNSLDIITISAKISILLTGKIGRSRVVLHRLFPTEFRSLSKEKADQFLTASGEDRRFLVNIYLGGWSQEKERYTREEKEILRQKAIKNARLLMKAYFSKHPAISWEDITTLDIIAISSTFYQLPENSKPNLYLVLRLLSHSQAGLLTPSKAKQWLTANSAEKRKLSRFYFYKPTISNISSDTERESMVEQSRRNALIAIEAYMEVHDINDVNDLDGEDIKKIYNEMYKLFEVPDNYPHLLLQKLFSESFGQFCWNTVRTFLKLRSFARRQQAYNYFQPSSGAMKKAKLYTAQDQTCRGNTIHKNALITFLFHAREKQQTLEQFGRADQYTLPSACYTALGIRHGNYIPLKEYLQTLLMESSDPSEFFWNNIVRVVDDPIRFFELETPENRNRLEECKEKHPEAYAVAVEKILNTPYHFALPEKNRKIGEIKSDFVNEFMPLHQVSKDPEAFLQKAVSLLLNLTKDRYVCVQSKAWQNIAALAHHGTEIPDSALESHLLDPNFHYTVLEEKWLREIPFATRKVLLDKFDAIGEKVIEKLKKEVEFFELVCQKQNFSDIEEETEVPWEQERDHLLARLKQQLTTLDKKMASEERVDPMILKKMLSSEIPVITHAGKRMLSRNLGKMPMVDKANFISALPTLLTSENATDKKLGMKLLQELKDGLAVLADTEREHLITLLQDLKSQYIS